MAQYPNTPSNPRPLLLSASADVRSAAAEWTQQQLSGTFPLATHFSFARVPTNSGRHVRSILRLLIILLLSLPPITSNLTHSHRHTLNINPLQATQIQYIKTLKSLSALHDLISQVTSTMTRYESVCRLCSPYKVP